MSADQLDAMLKTSLKMKSIRNDSSIPEEAKRKLLKPLELANQNAVLIADAKAEQEEKSQIVEAAERRADAIQTSGQEIAESMGVENATPAAPEGPHASERAEETQTGSEDIAPEKASVPAPTTVGTSPNYSASPPSNVGQLVDVQA
ncbi:hypothetical protein [Pseudoxanthomonas sp. PXM01]|uniref:hypothetical protein n=1 Tax=Pseudoxanthomonas sp. PXM01 TaxID=2769295 RepID=UPI0017818D98|nr:hypothetical protein [Pseudoxanthomonas sp. PXM01]MBD9469640.1 hypothetical protein [Pseudoxanthomonas sp. PXM01]